MAQCLQSTLHVLEPFHRSGAVSTLGFHDKWGECDLRSAAELNVVAYFRGLCDDGRGVSLPWEQSRSYRTE